MFITHGYVPNRAANYDSQVTYCGKTFRSLLDILESFVTTKLEDIDCPNCVAVLESKIPDPSKAEPAGVTKWLLEQITNPQHNTVDCAVCGELTQDNTEFCSVNCAQEAYEKADKPFG